MITVRLATLDPKTFPTESPASSLRAARAETESSGRDVVTDNSMKPAAISDRPRIFDKADT
jgi:hypothetical protein